MDCPRSIVITTLFSRSPANGLAPVNRVTRGGTRHLNLLWLAIHPDAWVALRELPEELLRVPAQIHPSAVRSATAHHDAEPHTTIHHAFGGGRSSRLPALVAPANPRDAERQCLLPETESSAAKPGCSAWARFRLAPRQFLGLPMARQPGLAHLDRGRHAMAGEFAGEVGVRGL